MSTSNMKKPFAFIPLLIVLGLGVLGVYWFQGEPRKAEVVETAGAASGFSKILAKGPMAGVIVHAVRKDVPNFTFDDDLGGLVSMPETFRGKVILLNLWATWCAPCRKEMPDLSKLQSTLGGWNFEVVALSVDRKGLGASSDFLEELGIKNLTGYYDPDAKSLAKLQALGLPATILIDRNGKEAARLLGPADWASTEAQAMIQALLDEK